VDAVELVTNLDKLVQTFPGNIDAIKSRLSRWLVAESFPMDMIGLRDLTLEMIGLSAVMPFKWTLDTRAPVAFDSSFQFLSKCFEILISIDCKGFGLDFLPRFCIRKCLEILGYCEYPGDFSPCIAVLMSVALEKCSMKRAAAEIRLFVAHPHITGSCVSAVFSRLFSWPMSQSIRKLLEDLLEILFEFKEFSIYFDVMKNISSVLFVHSQTEINKEAAKVPWNLETRLLSFCAGDPSWFHNSLPALSSLFKGQSLSKANTANLQVVLKACFSFFPGYGNLYREFQHDYDANVEYHVPQFQSHLLRGYYENKWIGDNEFSTLKFKLESETIASVPQFDRDGLLGTEFCVSDSTATVIACGIETGNESLSLLYHTDRYSDDCSGYVSNGIERHPVIGKKVHVATNRYSMISEIENRSLTDFPCIAAGTWHKNLLPPFDGLNSLSEFYTCVCSDSLYVYGGFSQIQMKFVTSIFQYSFSETKWTSIGASTGSSAMRPPPTTHGSFNSWKSSSGNVFLLLFGGSILGIYSTNFLWCFEVSSLCWSKIESHIHSPSPRTRHASTVVEDTLVVFGGFHQSFTEANHHEYFGDLWSFDLNRKKWSKHFNSNTQNPIPRCSAGIVAHPKSNRLYLFGGETFGNSQLGDLWMYDFSECLWTEISLGEFNPGHRTSAFMNIIDNDLFIYGGIRTKQGKISCTSDLWSSSLNSLEKWKRLYGASENPVPCRNSFFVDEKGEISIIELTYSESSSGSLWVYEKVFREASSPLSKVCIFDGVSSYLDLLGNVQYSFPDRTPYTIECCFISGLRNESQSLVSKINYNKIGEWNIQTRNAASIACRREAAPWEFVRHDCFHPGYPVYVSYRFDGQNVALFVNGFCLETLVWDAQKSDSETSVLVGACLLDNIPSCFFNGIISDVKIWSRALSNEEISVSTLNRCCLSPRNLRVELSLIVTLT
jgi:hypothetical protein